jgi:ribonuclease HI
MAKKVMSIWTDGSSHNNGEFTGIGGYGAVLIYSELPDNEKDLHSEYADEIYTKEAWGGSYPTTNQQMEIKAVTKSLERVTRHDIPIHVYSDSAYVVNCFKQGWWRGWMNNGWRNSKKEPVANRELWEELLKIINDNMLDITFHKVKGHKGIFYNEKADRLADKGTQKMKEKHFTNA